MIYWHLLLIASILFGLLLIIGILLIRILLEKRRPYLAYRNPEVTVLDKGESGESVVDYGVRLENAGTVPLIYNMLQYDVFVDGVLASDVTVKNTGDVIHSRFSRVYSRYFPIKCDMENFEGLVDWKIVFAAEYWALGKKKKYMLSYEVDIVSYHKDDWVRRDISTMLNVN